MKILIESNYNLIIKQKKEYICDVVEIRNHIRKIFKESNIEKKLGGRITNKILSDVNKYKNNYSLAYNGQREEFVINFAILLTNIEHFLNELSIYDNKDITYYTTSFSRNFVILPSVKFKKIKFYYGDAYDSIQLNYKFFKMEYEFCRY